MDDVERLASEVLRRLSGQTRGGQSAAGELSGRPAGRRERWRTREEQRTGGAGTASGIPVSVPGATCTYRGASWTACSVMDSS